MHINHVLCLSQNQTRFYKSQFFLLLIVTFYSPFCSLCSLSSLSLLGANLNYLFPHWIKIVSLLLHIGKLCLWIFVSFLFPHILKLWRGNENWDIWKNILAKQKRSRYAFLGCYKIQCPKPFTLNSFKI